MQPLPELHPIDPLHRDADCYSNTGIPAVVHVIPVVHVSDVNIVVVVPVISPGFGIGVNRADPIAVVLKARVSADNQEGKTSDSEPMFRPEVSTEPVVRYPVSTVATTLLPCAMV